MSSGFYTTEGVDFSDAFASGNSGIETGYYSMTGDDLGSIFALGPSPLTSGFIDSSGRDIARLFRIKGDASLQLMYIMTYIYNWQYYTIDFPTNSWYYNVNDTHLGSELGLTGGNATRSFGMGQYQAISESFDLDKTLYVYDALKAGEEVVFSATFDEAGGNSYSDKATGGMYFIWLEQPTAANGYKLKFALRASSANKKKALTLKVFADIYRS